MAKIDFVDGGELGAGMRGIRVAVATPCPELIDEVSEIGEAFFDSHAEAAAWATSKGMSMPEMSTGRGGGW